MVASPLVDRSDECQALRQVLDTVREGMSQTLVIRGEPGIGKTALLDYVTGLADEFRVERVVGIESEMDFGFAALHQLLMPFLPGLDQLPQPQRDALGSAFGLVASDRDNRFLVALATLSLLANASTDEPILFVIDDAQWLDRESAEILAFVARRLHADRVALLFAVRDSGVTRGILDDLPQLSLGGLPDAEARKLLDSVTGPIPRSIGDRLVAETGGNPLALIELGRELTPGQVEGGPGWPGPPLAVSHRLQELFVRQVRGLPTETQRLLLLAAAERFGDRDLLWRAAASLGIGLDAAEPAVAQQLMTVRPRVGFRHPLIRSAVYHGASGSERRAAHQALADALDLERDRDRRAWHRAAAAVGPDEELAADLSHSAAQATRRGGYAAAATLLGLAVESTPDPVRRAERQLDAAEAELMAGNPDTARDLVRKAQPRLDDPPRRAQALRLDGAIQFALGEGDKASRTLLRAAQAFEPVDARTSRDTMLEALEAAIYAHRSTAVEVARAAAALPPTSPSRPTPADLLLDGLAALFTAGHLAAAPVLRRAMEMLDSDDLPADDGLRWLGLGSWAAIELMDEERWRALAKRWMQLCRDRGALIRLAMALDYVGEWEAVSGHFGAAAALSAERREILAATGNPGRLGGVTALILPAWGGSRADARSVAAAITEDSGSRGQGVSVVYAEWALTVLGLGSGNYEAARVHALVVFEEDFPYMGTFVLPDLVEAAARSGVAESATAALQRLEQRAGASGTELAQGLLARCRALLADDSAAEALYREAVERLGRTHTGLELARAHLLYGEWLRRQRRRLDAREQLRMAYEMLLSMRAAGFAERARRELLATGGKARKRTEATSDELTPQEVQVAHLVSLGLTNPEIAAQLFISSSTVEYHLRKVYRKLGVATRIQLARLLNEQAESSRRPVTPSGDRSP